MANAPEWDDADNQLQDPEELKVLFTALDSYVSVALPRLSPSPGRRLPAAPLPLHANHPLSSCDPVYTPNWPCSRITLYQALSRSHWTPNTPPVTTR